MPARRRTSHLLRTATTAVAAAVVLSGCIVQTLFGFVDEEGVVSMEATVSASVCEPSTGTTASFACTLEIDDGSGGSAEATSTFDIVQADGVFGAIVDPLILQVPDSAGSVVATYDDGSGPRPMVVTRTDSFPVTPTETVRSETGTTFLIVEFPPSIVAALTATPQQFDVALAFTAAAPVNIDVKPMFTARVDLGGVPHYLPMFPCVTDFASVPAIRISTGFDLQDLLPQSNALLVANSSRTCSGVTYTFGAATTSTTMPSTTVPPPDTTVAPTTAATTTSITDSPDSTAVASTVGPTMPTVPPSSVSPLGATLPETGTRSANGVMVALALLVFGGGALLVARRPT